MLYVTFAEIRFSFTFKNRLPLIRYGIKTFDKENSVSVFVSIDRTIKRKLSMMTGPLLFIFWGGIAELLSTSYITRWVLKCDSSTPEMQKIGSYIVSGTNAYLKRQFKTTLFHG